MRLWRGKPTIYAERQKASDLVNRTCDPDPPYHPGGFRDIGREGDTPKKRIPARSFRNARAGIREAREALALEQAEMIDGAARVVSEAKRAPLREAQEKRDGRDRQVQEGGRMAAAVATRPARKARRDEPRGQRHLVPPLQKSEAGRSTARRSGTRSGSAAIRPRPAWSP